MNSVFVRLFGAQFGKVRRSRSKTFGEEWAANVENGSAYQFPPSKGQTAWGFHV